MFSISSVKELPIFKAFSEVLLPGGSSRLHIFPKHHENLLPDLTAGVKLIGVIPLKNETEDIAVGDIGTCGFIVKVIKSKSSEVKCLVTLGLFRFQIKEIISDTPYLKTSITMIHEPFDVKGDEELNKLSEDVKKLAISLITSSAHNHAFKNKDLTNMPSFVVLDTCMNCINFSFEEKCEILKAINIVERLKKGHKILLKFGDAFRSAEHCQAFLLYNFTHVSTKIQNTIVKITNNQHSYRL